MEVIREVLTTTNNFKIEEIIDTLKVLKKGKAVGCNQFKKGRICTQANILSMEI